MVQLIIAGDEFAILVEDGDEEEADSQGSDGMVDIGDDEGDE